MLAYEARQKADLEAIVFAPIINDIPEWYNFSERNIDWIEESQRAYLVQESDLDPAEPAVDSYVPGVMYMFNYTSLVVEGSNIIFVSDRMSNTGVFAPSLHTSPPPTVREFQSVDFLTQPAVAATITQSSTHNDTFAVSNLLDSSLASSLLNSISGRDQHTFNTENDGSLPTLGYAVNPVMRYPTSSSAYKDNDKKEDNVAGYLISFINWNRFLFTSAFSNYHIDERNSYFVSTCGDNEAVHYFRDSMV